MELKDARPEVAAFALLMGAKLRENDHKGGWKGNTSGELWERLREEAVELAEVLGALGPAANVGREAADVANFAMMIADVCGALATPERDDAPRR